MKFFVEFCNTFNSRSYFPHCQWSSAWSAIAHCPYRTSLITNHNEICCSKTDRSLCTTCLIRNIKKKERKGCNYFNLIVGREKGPSPLVPILYVRYHKIYFFIRALFHLQIFVALLMLPIFKHSMGVHNPL